VAFFATIGIGTTNQEDAKHARCGTGPGGLPSAVRVGGHWELEAEALLKAIW